MATTAYSGSTQKVAVAAIAGACAAVLFIAGVAVTVPSAVSLMREGRQDLREKQATLRQARAQCPASFDPTELGHA